MKNFLEKLSIGVLALAAGAALVVAAREVVGEVGVWIVAAAISYLMFFSPNVKTIVTRLDDTIDSWRHK